MVHYDIMRPFAKRFEHYANDPAIKELTTSGAALTVLTLAPNREVLLEQFIKRAADRDYVEWWDRRRWTRPLKRKIREAIYRLTGKKPKLLKEEQLRLLGLYASKNGLKRWLSEWESFLDGVRRGAGRGAPHLRDARAVASRPSALPPVAANLTREQGNNCGSH